MIGKINIVECDLWKGNTSIWHQTPGLAEIGSLEHPAPGSPKGSVESVSSQDSRLFGD